MADRDKLNEITLEARIDNVLREVFPSFKDVKVVHQKSFSINFGHHNILIDLKEPSKYPARAIFDILFTIEDVNVILLELKREDLNLTQEDVNQGISYARLIHPMPPLTLISNGTENWFYNTYTKEKLEASNIDFELLQKLTDNSFKLALNDFQNAVSTLLNNDYAVFSQVINQISIEKFSPLIGMLNDFDKPICSEFKIKRNITQIIEQHFSESAALVGVIGPAFCGKTNLLYQFFEEKKSEDNFLLYLDCNDHNYSILQQLANHFTKSAKILIEKDKVREWLINSLNNNTHAKFYLLLDNFNNEIPEEIKNEIIELIDVFEGVNHHILYTIDELNYKKIAFFENRKYKTLIGQQSKIVKLDELNDDEYATANDLLHNNFRIAIEHGGHYTPEYREPRILRFLAMIYQNEVPEGAYTQIVAVPDLAHLNAFAKNNVYPTQAHNLYKKITVCFLQEYDLRSNDAELSISASGSGAISLDIFKKHFPDDLDLLLKTSFVVLREMPNGRAVIYPKIPELIAYHSIPLIAEHICEQKKLGKPYNTICNILVDMVKPIPYCDIVGTGVLLKLVPAEEVEMFSELVQELLKIEPQLEKIDKGTKTIMYLDDVGHIELNFKDDMEEGGFISDFLPYAILSQIAGYPLRIIDSEVYSEFAFHLYLLYKVGSNENLIRRADVRSLKNMKQLEGYDWEGVGYIVSGHEGIIEPIVQSIQKCYMQIPEEIERLYNRGFEENNFPLLWRIYLALRNMMGFSNKDLAKQAKKFVKRFNAYFKVFMAEHISKDIEDPIEKERIKGVLLNMKK